MVGAREAGEGATTVVDGLVEGDDDVATEDDLDTDLVLFLGEDILFSFDHSGFKLIVNLSSTLFTSLRLLV